MLERCEQFATRRVATSIPGPAAASIPPALSRAGPSTVPRGSSRRPARGTSRSTPAATSILRGRPSPEGRWHVGIRHPHRADRVAAVLEADDLAIATSGAYARGDHVLDPHTGLPPSGLLSVTITGPTSPRPTHMRPQPSRWAAHGTGVDGPLDGYEAMSILTSDTVLSTPASRPRGLAELRRISGSTSSGSG